MSTTSIPRGLTRILLIALGLAVVVIAAIGMLRLSNESGRRSAELRMQIAAARTLRLEQRVPLEMSLLQYETDSRIKIWTAVIQAAGGAALLLGLIFSARNLRATQDKLDIDRQGQLTNRFIQATSQLGAELKDGQRNVEVRLGGIYALNRISNDWPKDYWPIADILTAYVRHNAAWKEPAREAQKATATDIQAILTVLGHNAPPGGFNDRRKLDLRFTDLRELEFYDAHLEWTDLYGAHLDRAQLWGAVLHHAKLDHANFTGANLRGAKMQNVTLQDAVFTGAMFDADTVWPAGFDAKAHGAVPV